MAAVLACGNQGALSHRSAAALWGIGAEFRFGIDLTIRRRGRVHRRGLRVRSRLSLPARDITRRHAIPVTTPLRTLIDLATELDDHPLERAVNQADVHDLLDPESPREELTLCAGEAADKRPDPGIRGRTRTSLPAFARPSPPQSPASGRPLAAAAGLPVPLTKDWVLGFEVDFHSPCGSFASPTGRSPGRPDTWWECWRGRAPWPGEKHDESVNPLSVDVLSSMTKTCGRWHRR